MAVKPVPPLGEKPLLVKSWWDSLGSGERLGLLASNPERIGGLDGVPADVRDRANRADLAAILSVAEAWGAEAEEVPLTRLAAEVGERVAAAIGNRASRYGLIALRDRIDRPAPVAGLAYHLIDFDIRADGKAVVSLGNPDYSDNVAVYVPGALSAVDESVHDYSRLDAMAGDAAARDGGRGTAVVRWLGYDAPDSIVPDAAGPRFAAAAVPALDRFTAGLRVTRDGPRTRITMIGHSYGGTVVGVTDRQRRLPVEAMVFVGAPGIGVARAGMLSVGAARVWATAAPGDLIERTPPELLGPPPTRPEFGAQVFTCDDTGRPAWWLAAVGAGRDAVKAHTGYWDSGNEARDNIAAIVVGDTAAVRLRG